MADGQLCALADNHPGPCVPAPATGLTVVAIAAVPRTRADDSDCRAYDPGAVFALRSDGRVFVIHDTGGTWNALPPVPGCESPAVAPRVDALGVIGLRGALIGAAAEATRWAEGDGSSAGPLDDADAVAVPDPDRTLTRLDVLGQQTALEIFRRLSLITIVELREHQMGTGEDYPAITATALKRAIFQGRLSQIEREIGREEAALRAGDRAILDNVGGANNGGR